jgi:all-trans-retinol dehydrogenase (NAD+)
MQQQNYLFKFSTTKKVTGGGNGLGREICLQLADQGCNIAVVDVDLSAAEKTAEVIKSKGLKCKAYKVDVTKSDEIIKLRDDLSRDLGPVDILVCSQI